jgi:hypothetical protein
MQDKIVTVILHQAAKAEGSTQALASRLHAPEATLLRWMDGRAQTPLRAFLAVLEFLMQLERKAAEGFVAEPPSPEAPHTLQADSTVRADTLTFSLGSLFARCRRCDGSEFRRVTPGTLRLTSTLACTSCGEEAIQGNLLAQLAKDAVHQSRAVAVRTQRAVDRARAIVERGKRRIEQSKAKIPGRTDGD